MLAENILSRWFCDCYEIDPTMECIVEFVNPEDLLVPNRLDLIAKMEWLDSLESNKNKKYAEEIYDAHIRAITGGTCIEGGKEKEKYNLESYKKVFRELKQSIQKGFDAKKSVIPVGEYDTIMDGAHRVAICIYYGIKVPIVRIPNLKAHIDAHFLSEYYMSQEMVEHLVIQYLKKKKNIYAVCIWPKGKDIEKRKVTEKIIAERTKIVYKKELMLSEHALHNIMIQIYRHFDWMGDAASHFNGAMLKASACFCHDSSTQFYFVEGPNLQEIVQMKSDIRNLFGVGNDSIHITDTWREAIQVANIVLNKNSLNLVQMGHPGKYEKLERLLDIFKKLVLERKGNLENYIIDSSAVMGLYGIRETNDIDYLCDGEKELSGFIDIENHMDFIQFHSCTLEELLNVPDNFLFYNEIKFISLKNARIFKQNRGEKKDLDDVRLIDSFMRNKFNLADRIYIMKYQIIKKIKVWNNEFHIWARKHNWLYRILRKVKYLFKRR